MKKRGIISIMTLLLVLFNAEAKVGTIKGEYSYKGENVKGVKVWISSKQDTIKLGKSGKFKIKNVDYKKDTLVFESFKGQSVIVPLHGSNIVSVERVGTRTTVDLQKETRKPSGNYGGIIYTQAELEQTGETSVWKAVMVKNPQRSVTSFLMSTTPLFFVDGVEVLNLDMPIKEIAFVELVKASNSGSSAFGVRGANGAVVATTAVKWKSTLEDE